ncbi:hypothetical protein DFH09DRAFT_362422 [Mycena vulgaris]|nr:hypothetical protein DFH09DRAFT_362422 [Mycena vulgaris]
MALQSFAHLAHLHWIWFLSSFIARSSVLHWNRVPPSSTVLCFPPSPRPTPCCVVARCCHFRGGVRLRNGVHLRITR